LKHYPYVSVSVLIVLCMGCGGGYPWCGVAVFVEPCILEGLTGVEGGKIFNRWVPAIDGIDGINDMLSSSECGLADWCWRRQNFWEVHSWHCQPYGCKILHSCYNIYNYKTRAGS